MSMDAGQYIKERLKPQIEWFEGKSKFNQSRYMLMRRIMLIASWLTPLAIFLQYRVPQSYQENWTVIPMILSTMAVGSYQWEEVHKFGPQWSKFRLVAEHLKHILMYFETGTGPFKGMSPTEAAAALVLTTEKTTEGTDINYFTLVVDPARDPAED